MLAFMGAHACLACMHAPRRRRCGCSCWPRAARGGGRRRERRTCPITYSPGCMRQVMLQELRTRPAHGPAHGSSLLRQAQLCQLVCCNDSGYIWPVQSVSAAVQVTLSLVAVDKVPIHMPCPLLPSLMISAGRPGAAGPGSARRPGHPPVPHLQACGKSGTASSLPALVDTLGRRL